MPNWLTINLPTLIAPRCSQTLADPKSSSIEQVLLRAWYAQRSWIVLLVPLSWLFRLAAKLRKSLLQALYQGRHYQLPVAVIGNISLGGSGKTPLLIALVKALSERGYSAAVISRGYGSKGGNYPLRVADCTPVQQCGDEPLLIKRKLAGYGSPVVVDANRRRAVAHIINHDHCDLVISDDGLQHYALHRDIEIAVIDGSRGFGNGQCLPAGPLREPISRLMGSDFVMVNGSFDRCESWPTTYQFELRPVAFRHLASGATVEPNNWTLSKKVHGVAAIGNPRRFAASLESLGLEVILHAANDHQQLTSDQLEFDDGLPVIITEKDAVKLAETDNDSLWVLDVDIDLPSEFVDQFLAALDQPPTKRVEI